MKRSRRVSPPGFIKEIEDLLPLIRAMTPKEQERLALSLRILVMSIEERRTMTDFQIKKLRAMRWAEIRSGLNTWRRRLRGPDDEAGA